MKCIDCGECCIDNEVLITTDERASLEKLMPIKTRKSGNNTLWILKPCCPFYIDREEKHCSIHDSWRPARCKEWHCERAMRL